MIQFDQELEKKYPKSCEELRRWLNHFYPEKDLEKLTDRYLYDFFDDMEIEVAILPFFSSFIWKVRPLDSMFLDGPQKYNNRQSAETAAFTKCFDLLEERLIQ